MIITIICRKNECKGRGEDDTGTSMATRMTEVML
jgi:hypothetical protein